MEKTKFIAFFILASIITSCDSGTDPEPAELFEIVTTIPTGTVSEPSGLVYSNARNSIFVVGDRGEIGEISSTNELINKETHDDRTFEGLTFDSINNRLYAVTEGDDNIIALDPDDFRILSVIQVDRTFNGATVINSDGNGLEGLTFVGETNGVPKFFAVNQATESGLTDDDSALLVLEIPQGTLEAKIVAHYPMTTLDLSGIFLDTSGRLFVISDNENKLLEISQQGVVMREHENLPGRNQEGLSRDAQGVFYMAQDSGDILSFKLNP